MKEVDPSWMTRRITYRKPDGRAEFKRHLGVFRMDSQGAEKLARYESIGTPESLENMVAKQDKNQKCVDEAIACWTDVSYGISSRGPEEHDVYIEEYACPYCGFISPDDEYAYCPGCGYPLAYSMTHKTGFDKEEYGR